MWYSQSRMGRSFAHKHRCSSSLPSVSKQTRNNEKAEENNAQADIVERKARITKVTLGERVVGCGALLERLGLGFTGSKLVVSRCVANLVFARANCGGDKERAGDGRECETHSSCWIESVLLFEELLSLKGAG